VSAQILMIRHAAHAQLGAVLSGRLPDMPLSAAGRRQADALAARLAAIPLDALHASPVQRAQETARALAMAQPGLAIETVPALDEVDFGEWQGRAFAQLAGDPRWEHWNAQRGSARAPGGESMAAAQDRAWRHVVATALARPGATIAMVSHCDVIRAVVARVLGLPLDRLLSFEVGPASLTRIEIGEWGSRLHSLNEVCRESCGDRTDG
jgi:broad specificity phosphatase PhoE